MPFLNSYCSRILRNTIMRLTNVTFLKITFLSAYFFENSIKPLKIRKINSGQLSPSKIKFSFLLGFYRGELKGAVALMRYCILKSSELNQDDTAFKTKDEYWS